MQATLQALNSLLNQVALLLGVRVGLEVVVAPVGVARMEGRTHGR